MSEYSDKNDYLVYYRQVRAKNQIPETFANWLSNKKKKTVRTKSVESGLKNAGLSEADIARLRGRK